MTWSEFSTAAPELASRVEKSLGTGKHKVMATLRRDGSPRVSGTEVEILDGDLWLGSMPGAMKARDLRRDPRLAIHGPTVDETMAVGDAKLSGRAEEITDPDQLRAYISRFAEDNEHEPPQPFHLFRVLLDEVVLTRVDGEDLVVEHWRRDRSVTTTRRR